MFLTEDGQIQSEAPQTYLIEGKNKRNKKNKRPKKRSVLRKVIKAFFITLLIVFLIILLSGGYIAYKFYEIAKDVKMTREDLVIKHENSVVKDEGIAKSVFEILSSCVKYGQIKKFYEIVKQYKDYLTSDDLSFFAKEIFTTFSDDENLYPTTLRIASSAFSNSGTGKDLELLQILYPRYFYDLIKDSCTEYNLDEFILLGLIRTESYFDKDIFSAAGASGLTQLMNSTASDIARKLRVKEFDLLDAKTNIAFGSFYLNELTRRLDGSVLKAIISYNTGITRVRRWATQFANVPQDIWIEMFPYEESREYGKKVLANAFVYGLLYYNKTSYEIVDMFMK
jgi:soluble lytic murein transglycosylase